MERLRRLLLALDASEKNKLRDLYGGVKDFVYIRLRFSFSGTGPRMPEKLMLQIRIPSDVLGRSDFEPLVAEDYLLRRLAPITEEMNREIQNTGKDLRDRPEFISQPVNERCIRRSGMRFDAAAGVFVWRVVFRAPLQKSRYIDGKGTYRVLHELMRRVSSVLEDPDSPALDRAEEVYHRQRQIRTFLRSHRLAAFVADGAILPRENGTSAPKQEAIPFRSPDSLAVFVDLADGTTVRGMGIPAGITVITGGGYSGKSTLLDALESGIYDRIPGDGREYVLSDPSALRISAEDGRPVTSLDLSAFFRFLPGGDPRDFSTPHASGSVSQAAGIAEAVYGGARLLLMDEDQSAVNFMLRDAQMRRLVPRDPIIPFTDRIRELYEEYGVSVVLVIGSCSDYLAYADTVLRMEDFSVQDITAQIRSLHLVPAVSAEAKARFPHSRRLLPRQTSQAFLYFRSVQTENARIIRLDGYSVDISYLTAIISQEQIHALACLLEAMLCDPAADEEELTVKLLHCTERILQGDASTASLIPERTQLFCEEIRPLDALCCLNRLRGVSFSCTLP